MAGSERGLVALGVLRSLAPQFAPALMRRFGVVHPEVRFSLTEDSRDRLIEHLEGGRVNLCLTVRVDHPRVVWRRIAEQELVLVVPRAHRLAGRRSVHLSDVAHERFISFKRGYPARERADELCRDADFEPMIVAESDESNFIRGSVAAGSGIAIIPRTGEGELVCELTIEQPGASREIGIASVPGRFLSEAERLFQRFVIEDSHARS
jgi:DNA-binding transcriptional LysR family regulator